MYLYLCYHISWLCLTDCREVEEVCTRLNRLRDTEVVNCAVDEHHRWYSITGLYDHGQVSTTLPLPSNLVIACIYQAV